MPNVNLDITGYLFQAKGQAYPIEAGQVVTTHSDAGSVSWDWEAALELKTSDAIPSNETTAILWPDGTVFVKVRVIRRRKEGGLSVLTLVPDVKEA